MGYQTPESRRINRKDHVWVRVGEAHKCVLCGGLTYRPPPDYPTPPDWLPARFEPVLECERGLAPFRG